MTRGGGGGNVGNLEKHLPPGTVDLTFWTGKTQGMWK